MANKVVLEQKVDPFKNLSPVLNPIFDGLTTFGNNFSVIAGTLIEFFTVTKVFLTAIRNPLAGPLLNTIDSLIAVLEDLRDIGVGNTTVWPWEFGEFPPNLDTSKLDSAIASLIANLEGIDPKLYRFDPDGNLVKTKNGVSLIEPGSDLGSFGASNITKDSVYSSLLALRNFFHPETWAGNTPSSGDDDFVDDLVREVKDVINFTRKNLIVKELTPQGAVDKVIQSLRSSSPDANRPTGTGDYQAYVMLFALPTINGVLQVVQAFIDYFGSVLGDELVQKYTGKSTDRNDEETEVIRLGLPLMKTETRGVSPDEAFYNFEDLKNRNILNGSYDENGVIDSQSPFVSFNPETGQQSASPEAPEVEAEIQATFNKIPVFLPGDIIAQVTPTGFQIYSAEVVEHLPIEIENGLIVQNRVKVKSVRGDLQKSTGSNTSPPVRLVARSGDDPDLKDWPIFKSTREAEKVPQIVDSFFATCSDGSVNLSEIVPNDVVGAQLRSIIATSQPKALDWQVRIIMRGNAGFASQIVSSYVNFFRKLSKGMIVRHEFIQPFNLSKSPGLGEYYDKSLFTDSKFRFNYGKLMDLIPSVGVTFHLAKILVDGEELENLSDVTPEKLFRFNENGRVYDIKPMSFVLGQKNFDGTYNTELLSEFINVPGEKVEVHQRSIGDNPVPPFELYTTAKDIVPTWKFIRIQDLFPIYGDTISRAIGQVEGFRSQVKGLIKDIDPFIEFLERQIEAITELNDSIQQFINLFVNGLRGAGIYSGSFSGRGVNDFINKLNSMQLKKSADAEKLKEISLETVEIDAEVTDPFTGLTKIEKRKVLRPTAKVVDEDTPADDQPRPLSAFDQLKYSGMIVFYAQGNDTQKFQSFMDNFSGLRALGAGLLANAFGAGDSIVDKLRPKVFEIQAENDSGDFVNLEQLGSIDTSGTIRIVFTNEGHSLNDAEREAIEDQMERGVEFFPKIEKGSATFSSFGENDIVDTSGDSITLFQGEYDPDAKVGEQFTDGVFFELEPQAQFSSSGGGEERGFFNIDIKTKDPLPRSEVRYKLAIKTSIVSTEGLPSFRFVFDVGFSINPIKVASGSLI